MRKDTQALPPCWEAYGDLFRLAQDELAGKRVLLVDRLNEHAKQGFPGCSYCPRDIDYWTAPPKGGQPARMPRRHRRRHLHHFFKELLERNGKLAIYADRLQAIAPTTAAVLEQKRGPALTQKIIDKASITVDFSLFSPALAPLKLDYAAFACVLDFMNHVWVALGNLVPPHTYGHSWVLRDKASGTVIRTLRMIKGLGPGFYYADARPLREAGIKPGMELQAIRFA